MSSDLISFEECTPHMVRWARCGLCKYKAVAVIPQWHNTQNGLECPICKMQTMMYEFNNPEDEPPPLRCI